MRRFLAVIVGIILMSVGEGGLRSQEVSAAPPTTPTDLNGVTQNWDKNLPSASRFTVLAAFGNQAVRDNNTGLVWEQAPDATPRAFAEAILHCLNRTVGGTTGWRMPSVVELKSLQDPALPAPFVPATIFTGVQPDIYSVTTYSPDPIATWLVYFAPGAEITATQRSSVNHVWCVRGPMQESVY
ncbi:DUF1566 domain-containing protein [Nitrospira sp. NS4]|uniref:Lcl C-terminal domain-containing protein n=1 Tax=Nitrospira sp. NS4 TaxID=3414498 RepID=UPI003C2CA455